MRKVIELPCDMLESRAYKSLSGNERALLLELQLRSERGSASMGVVDASKNLRICRATVTNAFDRLEKRGFLESYKPGSNSVRQHRLTWMGGSSATNDWRRWR